MEYPKLENLNSSNCTERSIELHYPDFWKYIIENYHHSTNWTERLYWFYHNLTDFPKCPICGERTKFINIKTGYREFCSTKCMNSSKLVQEKKKETSRKNWGTDNPMQNSEIQSKLKKSIINKYGVDNVFKSEEIKRKIKQTCLVKYGVEHHLQNQNIMNKQKNTNIDKYGVEYIFQRDDYKQKIKQTCEEKYGGIGNASDKILKKYINTIRSNNINQYNFLIGYTENGDWICKCPHDECDKCDKKYYITNDLVQYSRSKNNIETCTNIFPINKDNTKNTSLESFIRNVLTENNIDFITNVRNLIAPKELDIYIPSKNIAIECNGCFWHSSINKLSSYHIQKYKSCHLQNIQLLSIWEDWVKTKPQIIESIILNKLGLCSNTIYARKTQIREVDSKLCNEFLDNNHIQGKSTSTIKLGLYYNDKLVSIMTFSKPRVNMGGKEHKQEWELVRFCNKLNTRVIGGASKLLKYFIKTYNPKSIVSFSMNDISDGNLYKQLGFKTDGVITRSYWYIEPSTFKRYHRATFTKQAIVKKGWKDKIDDTWTEKQVMEERGYFCLCDSGQMKWILDLKTS